MKKYFKIEDDEHCFPLDYHIETAEPEEKEIILYEAKMEVGEPYFWCSVHDLVGEVGEGCGKECEHYKPRNGKSGRCRFSKNCYSPIKKVKVIINESGKHQIINLDEEKSN